MLWCHGHVKPKEIFYAPGQEVMYLTDFAHTKMYPQGYEYAFIIWADWFMDRRDDWNLSYGDWFAGIEEWLTLMRPIAEQFGIADFDKLMKAALAERALGTILADITASRKEEDGDNLTIQNREKKIKRITLLYWLLDLYCFV